MTIKKPTKATSDAIAHGAQLIRQGALVAFPTETVYGLGADATNDLSVATIFEAKGRPRFNPLIVHVHEAEYAFEYGDFDELTKELCQQFWPGPLTFVVRRREPCPLSQLVSAGLESVALRLPAHNVARELIKEAGVPLAAPSANRSGSISPTRADHVAVDLGSAVAMILDGGPCSHGLESTVLRIDGSSVTLLRAGSIPRHALEAITGPMNEEPVSSQPSSPGQLTSHYAPRHNLRLNVTQVEDHEALLAFGTQLNGNPIATKNLSPRSDLKEAAANFFAFLRDLDEADCDGIAVMPIPEEGLGEAINDRLRRAAAARN